MEKIDKDRREFLKLIIKIPIVALIIFFLSKLNLKSDNSQKHNCNFDSGCSKCPEVSGCYHPTGLSYKKTNHGLNGLNELRK